MALVRKGLLAKVGSGRSATYRMPSKRPTIGSNGSSPWFVRFFLVFSGLIGHNPYTRNRFVPLEDGFESQTARICCLCKNAGYRWRKLRPIWALTPGRSPSAL